LTQTPHHEPGAVLDGKYEVLRHLGGGGMGEVYLVRHVHLEEKRVVKILRADRVADPDAQKRFLREARFATQIKHPHVAILYDYSRLGDGSFYMVWEYIEGEDVGSRIRRAGPFPARAAVTLAIQGLEGLAAIHGAGMIHRDVSPDNLMIAADGPEEWHLKIIDLGLAKNLEADPDLEVTQDGMFMGKLLYCAPEQAGVHKGETLDNRTDLYSFGLVLYEMIAGQPPFEAETPHGAIFKRLSEDPIPLTRRNPRAMVPAELEPVVMRALAREREDRYPDARKFIEALSGVARRLDRMETQEVPRPAGIAPAPLAPGDVAGLGAPRPQELTRAEKENLLARIEQAARRAREATPAKPGEPSGTADAEGRAAETRAPSEGTGEERASAARASAEARAAERRARIEEAEAMIQRYLQKKRLSLARLALDTLIELAPNHPKRSDYESWVDILVEEVEQEKRADGMLADGREALVREDFRAARRQLAQLHKLGDDRAETFEREVDQAETSAQASADQEEARERIDRMLRERRLEEAQQEIKALAGLGASKVTLDLYRSRLEETRRDAHAVAQADVFLEAFRERIDAGDHAGAREVAGEFQRAVPDDPRPSELLSEVSGLERDAERARAVEQGVAQVEGFIDRGDAAQARLALRVLLQMAPDLERRRQLEKRIAKLK
jgi:eukaryotic-like serine/threonine-protein kinase